MVGQINQGGASDEIEKQKSRIKKATVGSDADLDKAGIQSHVEGRQSEEPSMENAKQQVSGMALHSAMLAGGDGAGGSPNAIASKPDLEQGASI